MGKKRKYTAVSDLISYQPKAKVRKSCHCDSTTAISPVQHQNHIKESPSVSHRRITDIQKFCCKPESVSSLKHAGKTVGVGRKKLDTHIKHKKQGMVSHKRRNTNTEKKHKKINRQSNEIELVNERKEHKECEQLTVSVPGAPKGISFNWKNLQKTLKTEKKRLRHQHDKVEVRRRIQSKEIPQNISTKGKIWFDDVDEILVQSSEAKPLKTASCSNANNSESTSNQLVKKDSYCGVTKIVAMDCEMVGVGTDGEDSILARVSIVNQYGQCIYDKLVKPTETIRDYRTPYSGIRPGDLDQGQDFKVVQKDVYDILKDRVLVGHALHNDLKVLYLDHPHKLIRDTSKYKPFRRIFQGRIPSLKKLSDQLLGVQVQKGEHDSIQDAQAAMRLYTMHRKTWEREFKLKKHNKQTKGKTAEIMPFGKNKTKSVFLDSDEDK